MKAKPTFIGLGILVTAAFIAFFAFALLIPNTFGFWGCHFRVHVLPRNSRNRDKLRSLLYELDDTLKKNQIAYWLSEGTCLGAVREEDIIVGDTDVDIGIEARHKTLFYKNVLPALRQKGFRLGRGEEGNNNKITTIFKDDEYVDIDFTGTSHRCFALELGGGACQPIMDVLAPFQTAKIGSRSFVAPSLEYIELLYGPDWRIPKKNFKPWDNA
jgi:hypothetical protein